MNNVTHIFVSGIERSKRYHSFISDMCLSENVNFDRVFPLESYFRRLSLSNTERLSLKGQWGDGVAFMFDPTLLSHCDVSS